MAGGRIKGITIEIEGDSKGLKKALEGVDGQLAKTQRSLKDVNRLLKMDPGNIELLRQKQKLLADQISKTKERLQQLKDASKSVTPDDIGQDKYDALQREIVDTENKLESLENEYKEFGSVGAQKIKAVGDKMTALGEGMKDVGGKLTKYVTGPIVALGAASAASWKEIDDALDTVTKKTGATGDELEAMHQTVRDIATSMPVTFEDVGTAVGEVNTRFGVTGEALQSLSEDFLKFASINDTDVNNSIDTIQSAMAAFNTETEKAPEVLDLFTAAGQKTGVPIEQLAEKLKQNAVALQEMGFGLEDSIMFLAQLDKSGADSQTVLAGLKGALKNATKEGKPMSEALSDMQEKLKGAASDTEAAQLATELFGSKAGAAIAEYVRNGQLDFESLGVSMEEYAGLVDQTFENTQDPADEFQTTMNEIKELGFEIAESVMPVVKDVLTQLKDIIEQLKAKWEELSPEQQKMITDIALLAAAIGPVLLVLGQLVMIVGTVLTYAPMITAALGTVAGAFSWPVVAIAALVAACIWLGQHWDQVCEWANNLKEKVSAAIEGMKQRVHDSIEGVKAKFQEMKDKVSNIMNMVKQDISDKIEAAKAKVSSVVDAIKDKMSFSGMVAKVSGIFESLKSSMADKVTAAKDKISGIVDAIKGFFSNMRLSIPSISLPPLPHFSLSGSFSLNPPSVPHLSVSWYKKAMDQAMTLSGATIFGQDSAGRLLGAGEAGREVISGEDHLLNLISGVVGAQNSEIAEKIGALASIVNTYLPYVADNMGSDLVLDDGTLVGKITPKVSRELAANQRRYRR